MLNNFLIIILRGIYLTISILSLLLTIKILDVFNLPNVNINYNDIDPQEVSIIIPVRNDSKNLYNLLKNLGPSKFEVIVVDDDSEDDSYDVALNFSELYNYKVIKVKKPDDWLGKPYACYVGYKNSNGKYLVFIDSDVHVEYTYLKKFVSMLKKYDVVSSVPIIKCHNILSSIIEYPFNILVSIFYSYEKVCRLNRPWLAGSMQGWCREAYEKIGGHIKVKNSILEDVELGKLSCEKNLRVTFVWGNNWYVNWNPKYRDILEFFKRIVLFIGDNGEIFFLMIIIGIILSLFVYLTPYLYILNILSFVELIVYDFIIWLPSIVLITIKRIKPKYISLILYPFSFFLIGYILNKAYNILKEEKYIMWRNRKIQVIH